MGPTCSAEKFENKMVHKECILQSELACSFSPLAITHDCHLMTTLSLYGITCQMSCIFF